MISLNETLLTAAGLFGLGASAASAGNPTESQDFRDFDRSETASDGGGRTLSQDDAAADDPFFTAVADALREAGYLDS